MRNTWVIWDVSVVGRIMLPPKGVHTLTPEPVQVFPYTVEGALHM